MINTIPAFRFSTCQNIICEQGVTSRLADVLKAHQFQSVMFITDPGIIKTGIHLEALNSLRQSGMSVFVYSDVQADPPENIVLEATHITKNINPDVIIGFGGGSSMDVAKIVALLSHPHCSQKLPDVYGVDNAQGPRLPLIQIPTTAGTGSEVTQVAIVTTGETTKTGIVTPLFFPDYAILDSTLTTGLPPAITAATGIDAMVHAIEAYTSKIKKNPLSDMIAKESLHLLGSSIMTATHTGSDLAARESMLLGAMLAGQTFANAPVAAVHALAYPLGGRYHIPHGLSNSLVLPHVMRFNLPDAAHHYAELAPFIFEDIDFQGSDSEIALRLISEIETLIRDLHLPTSLREMDIKPDAIPLLAEDAMKQTRLLINNPTPVNINDAEAIYRSAY